MMSAIRKLLRRRSLYWKVVLAALVFITFLFLMQREMVGTATQEPWLREMVVRKDKVLDIMMGAVNNIKEAIPRMQIGAPVREQMPTHLGKLCLPGHFTVAELKPFMERPHQDPNEPGAGGNPYLTDNLTPEEQKERIEETPNTASTSLQVTASPYTETLDPTPGHLNALSRSSHDAHPCPPRVSLSCSTTRLGRPYCEQSLVSCTHRPLSF